MEKSTIITVNVYSPQIGEKKVETSAKTWGELQNDLSSAGINISGMKSVIGETQLTLESGKAVLPEEDFTLFLMQKKTKSGSDDIASMGYRDLRSKIQTIVAEDGDHAKDHFNKDRNYTTKSTADLRSLLSSYSSPKVQEAPVAQAADDNEAAHEDADLLNFQKALKILEDVDVSHIDDDIQDEVKESVDNLTELYNGLVNQTQVNERNSELSSKYNDLASEFSDVR